MTSGAGAGPPLSAIGRGWAGSPPSNRTRRIQATRPRADCVLDRSMLWIRIAFVDPDVTLDRPFDVADRLRPKETRARVPDETAISSNGVTAHDLLQIPGHELEVLVVGVGQRIVAGEAVEDAHGYFLLGPIRSISSRKTRRSVSSRFSSRLSMCWRRASFISVW